MSYIMQVEGVAIQYHREMRCFFAGVKKFDRLPDAIGYLMR